MKASDGRYVFPHGHGLSTIERQRIGSAIAEMKSWLLERIPMSGGPAVQEIVGMLHGGFKIKDISQTRQAFYESFIVALGGGCAPAMYEAGRRLLRGEGPSDMSLTFCPTAAEFVTFAKAIEQDWKTEVARLERLLAMTESRPAIAERQATPEEVAAALEKVRRMGAASSSPAPDRSDGVSPAARVAAETAARKSARQASSDHSTEGD